MFGLIDCRLMICCALIVVLEHAAQSDGCVYDSRMIAGTAGRVPGNRYDIEVAKPIGTEIEPRLAINERFPECKSCAETSDGGMALFNVTYSVIYCPITAVLVTIAEMVGEATAVNGGVKEYRSIC